LSPHVTDVARHGYELVLSFPQPGELLGFEALHAGGLHTSALALEHATVYALPIAELHELQRRFPPLERAVRTALSRQLARAGEAAEMMAPVASDARLARFLLWLSARMAEAGQSPHRLRLRMPRRDIGSLLGLAHETISRSLTMLVECGCLRVDKRDIEILDMYALRVRARNTRGLHAEALPRQPGARTARTSSNDWWGLSLAPVAA
jgi:CRP/FNR family transcriptional regulator